MKTALKSIFCVCKYFVALTKFSNDSGSVTPNTPHLEDTALKLESIHRDIERDADRNMAKIKEKFEVFLLFYHL